MAASEELISLVVSVYNLETRLPKCLESISAQSYRNLEIILIDDGSTDGSGKLCDDFAATDSRVRVIHQENRGLASVRNRGVAESKGDYLMFPDGDDYFHKDYVRLLYEAINQREKAYPLAICDFAFVSDYMAEIHSDSEVVFKEMKQTELLDTLKTFPACQHALWGANWNKIYRRSALSEPFQRDFARCQDFDSNLSVFFSIDSAVFVPKVLYYWVQWPGQRTRSVEDMQLRNACRSRIYYDHFLNCPESLDEYRPYLLINLYKRLIYWRDRANGTSGLTEAMKMIRWYERKTFFSFWSCSLIPFARKVRWKLSLHAPRLLERFGRQVTPQSV